MEEVDLLTRVAATAMKTAQKYGKMSSYSEIRVGLYVYCQARTIIVLIENRARGSLLVELPLLRPVTPIHNYRVFSKEAAIVKETPNIKNECKGRGGRPARSVVSSALPPQSLTHHSPDW